MSDQGRVFAYTYEEPEEEAANGNEPVNDTGLAEADRAPAGLFGENGERREDDPGSAARIAEFERRLDEAIDAAIDLEALEVEIEEEERRLPEKLRLLQELADAALAERAKSEVPRESDHDRLIREADEKYALLTEKLKGNFVKGVGIVWVAEAFPLVTEGVIGIGGTVVSSAIYGIARTIAWWKHQREIRDLKASTA